MQGLHYLPIMCGEEDLMEVSGEHGVVDAVSEVGSIFAIPKGGPLGCPMA